MLHLFGVLPFTFALEDDDVDPSRDTTSRIWAGSLCRVYSILLLHLMNTTFAKIPMGYHTFSAIIIVGMLCCFISFSLRKIFGSMAPLDGVLVGVLAFIFTDIAFGMTKFIPVRDRRTGQTKNYNIGTLLILFHT